MGFSLCWLLSFRSTGSRARGPSSGGSWALEHGLNTCGAGAYLLRGMWALPGAGIKPMFLSLAGGFFTTEPLGKPQSCLLFLAPSRLCTPAVGGGRWGCCPLTSVFIPPWNICSTCTWLTAMPAFCRVSLGNPLESLPWDGDRGPIRCSQITSLTL